jgi:peptidoglycan/xylan/chitin deacetylase (PgdA/CDA1 family)
MADRRGLKDLARPQAARLIGSINGARTDDPVVSFTFDDGPDEAWTPLVLEALAEHGARATFFVLGEQARRHPDLVRRIRSAGHEVGSHSDSHRVLSELPIRAVRRDIRRSKQDLEQIIGEPIELFRPPFGFLSRGGYLAARSLSLDVVAWSCEARDWEELPIEELVENAFSRLRSGGILLLHDGLEPAYGPDPPPLPTFDRANMVRRLLDEAAARGWRSVSVGELLEGRPVDRKLWFRRPAGPTSAHAQETAPPSS